MRWRILVLKDGTRTKVPERRQSNKSKNLVSVPNPIQDTVNMMQWGPGTKTHATPHHHRTDTVSIVFTNGGIHEPLTLASPHTNSAVIKGQGEPGFIGKQYSVPLLSCPVHMIACPGQSSVSVDCGKHWSDSRSS